MHYICSWTLQEKRKEEEPLDGDDSPKEKKDKKKKVCGGVFCVLERGVLRACFFVVYFMFVRIVESLVEWKA